jgi:hypothetical protein
MFSPMVARGLRWSIAIDLHRSRLCAILDEDLLDALHDLLVNATRSIGLVNW